MNINLELYKVFYVVAKNKHMTKASEELHISQPAISQSIKKLEEELGGTLFIRSNKGMELTSEGKMFYDYIKSALELIQNAENEFTLFKDLSKGSIKLGASTTLTKIVLMDKIKEFHQDYPNIELNIVNDLTSNLIIDLQKGKLDFVVFNEGNIKENNITMKEIKKLKHGFLYHPDYFKDTFQSLKDLIEAPLILQNKESNSRKFLDAYMLKNNIELNAKIEVVSQDLVLQFTDAGLGIGFGIIELAKKKYPNLKELKLNELLPTSSIYLAQNKSIHLPFASQKFLEYLSK